MTVASVFATVAAFCLAAAFVGVVLEKFIIPAREAWKRHKAKNESVKPNELQNDQAPKQTP